MTDQLLYLELLVIQNKHFVPLTLKYLEVVVDVNNLILRIDRQI